MWCLVCGEESLSVWENVEVARSGWDEGDGLATCTYVVRTVKRQAMSDFGDP
jgi:hypothetical protein